jgi:LPXTG-motif cell wall-anchored protein
MKLAFDVNGNLYGSESNENRIVKFSFPKTTKKVSVKPSNGLTSPSQITISTASSTDITCQDSLYGDELPTPDTDNEYPLGLAQFCLDVPDGSIQQVELIFETDMQPEGLSARLFNPDTNTFSDIAGASITQTTIDGNPALSLSYQVEDGGQYDQDNTVNGIVENTSGMVLGVSTTSSGGNLANTGANTIISITLGLTLLTITTLAYKKRHVIYRVRGY